MAQVKIPKFESTARTLTYSDFSGGLDYLTSPSMLNPKFSPECQNVRVRDGSISKRSGYSRLFPTSLGTGQINGLFQYKKANGDKYELVAHSDKLYLIPDIDI